VNKLTVFVIAKLLKEISFNIIRVNDFVNKQKIILPGNVNYSAYEIF